MTKNKYLSTIQIVLHWIFKFWFKANSQRFMPLMHRYFGDVRRMILNNGPLYTMKYYKEMRLCVTRWISGERVSVSNRISLDRDGFPNRISYLKEGLAEGGDLQFMRAVFTLFSINRAIPFKNKPDYSSITNPYTGRIVDFKIWDEFMIRFVDDFRLTMDKPWWGDHLWFLTRKAGPLGDALLTSMWHLKKYNGINWGALQSLINLGPLIRDWKPIAHFWRGVSHVKHPHVRNRRLSLVYDPEAKCRVIAIADYITQAVLNPVSEQMFQALRHFPQDRTFTQDPHIVAREGQMYHSLDLSSATDRFPVMLQERLLGHMIDRRWAYGWKSAMVGEAFVTPEGHSIKYAVGQPMGLRTSWPMFTISHHFIVQLAAHQLGVYPTNDYILLGDDLVITNDKLANQYRKLCTELGIEISPMKTHVSVHTYEFAKRWFHHGVEITGLSVNAIVQTLVNPMLVWSYINELFKRGVTPDNFTHSISLVLGLFSTDPKWRNKLRYLRNVLTTFRFVVNLESLTDSEIRHWLAEATSNGGHPLPDTRVGLLTEVKRVSASALNGVAYRLLKKLSRYQMDFKIHVNEYLPGTQLDNPSAQIDIKVTPVYLAIKNSIAKLDELNRCLVDPNWSLVQGITTLALVDLERLAKRERSSIMQLYQMSRFGTELWYQFRNDVEYSMGRTRDMQVKKLLRDLKHKF